MNNQLTYLIAQQRKAELQQAGERARHASARRRLRRPNLIARPGAQTGQGSPASTTALELEPTIASER